MSSEEKKTVMGWRPAGRSSEPVFSNSYQPAGPESAPTQPYAAGTFPPPYAPQQYPVASGQGGQGQYNSQAQYGYGQDGSQGQYYGQAQYGYGQGIQGQYNGQAQGYGQGGSQGQYDQAQYGYNQGYGHGQSGSKGQYDQAQVGYNQGASQSQYGYGQEQSQQAYGYGQGGSQGQYNGQSQYSQSQYGQSQYGQGQQQSQYSQSQYGQSQYGQSQYGQSQYGQGQQQSQYGQSQYGQGQQQSQYGQYDQLQYEQQSQHSQGQAQGQYGYGSQSASQYNQQGQYAQQYGASGQTSSSYDGQSANSRPFDHYNQVAFSQASLLEQSGSTGKNRPIDGADATYGQSARLRFIRLTYLHLFLAILAFAGLEFLLFKNSFLAEKVSYPLVKFALGGRWNWGVVLLVFMGVSYVADYWARSSASRGLQYAGLGFYVVAEALIFVPLLAIVEWKTQAILAKSGGNPHIIRDAALITLAIFSALTLSVFITKKDFSFLRSGLMMAGTAALMLIGLSLAFGFNLGIIFSVAMVLLASGYVLYQTSQVMAHYDPRQHVAAALALFSSVALMFWYVIRILMRARE